jgi:hypothetical protein
MSDKLPSPDEIFGRNKLPSPDDILKKKGASQLELKEMYSSLDTYGNQDDQPLESSGDGDIYTYGGIRYKKTNNKWYREYNGSFVRLSSGNVAQREKELNANAKRVAEKVGDRADKWAGVTEGEAVSKPKYRKEDYIDVIQNKEYKTTADTRIVDEEALQMQKEYQEQEKTRIALDKKMEEERLRFYTPDVNPTTEPILANRDWSNVTEEKITTTPKYKTDDYIDVIQNKEYKGSSKGNYDEAVQMMKDDFGAKEWESYNKVDGIGLDIILDTEENSVTELNKRFRGSGIYFEETGAGDQIKVISSADNKFSSINEEVFNLYPALGIDYSDGGKTLTNPKAQAEQERLQEFIRNSLLKKSEKEYLNSKDLTYENMVKLKIDNPRKYGETFLSEDELSDWLDKSSLDIASSVKWLKKTKNDVYKQIKELEGKEISDEVSRGLKYDMDRISIERDRIIKKQEETRIIQEGAKTATGYYYSINEEKGNLGGIIGRGFVKGLMNIPKMEADLVADILPFYFGDDATSSLQRSKMEAAGMSNTEINNALTRDLKNKVNEKAVESLQDILSFGTTKEYVESEKRNDIEKVASFLSESIGTIASAGGNPTLSKLAFFAQSYNAMEDQMKSSEFDELNIFEKKLLSVPYGMVIGYLERLGFKVSTGGSKLLNGIVTSSISRALTQVPKGASIELMRSAINKSVAATMAEAGLSIVAGSIVEGFVEGTQNITEVGAKQLFNNIEGKDYFKDVPDLTTKDGMAKALEMASEDFYYGMLGGLVMGSGSQAVSAVRDGYSNNKLDANFEVLYNSVTDPNLRRMVKSEIKANLANGTITKEVAKEQMDAIGKSYSIFKSMPDKLSMRERREAFNLIREKQIIQKEIEGKDPSLVDAQKKRVSEIDEQLKQISNNATKETTDKQQAVTAEGGVSQYQGAGEGQQEVGVSEGGQRQATVNETDSGDSTIPSKVQEEVATYRAEEQAELLKAIPKIESYKVNGEVDKNLMPKTALDKYNKIYNKYDKLISPLLETTSEITIDKPVIATDATVSAVPKIIDTKDTKSYSNALSEAKDALKKEGNGLDLQVSDVSKEEADAIIAEGGNIFMTEDGLAGAYVKKDGYMGGLFKSPKATYSKVAKLLQQARVKVGGRFMDAYATELEKIYVNNGFRPVARLKFNEEYAPEGWDAPKSALASKPDVVFFAYDPDGNYKIGDGEYLEDYDVAYEMAKNFDAKALKDGGKVTTAKKTEYNKNLVTPENAREVASKQDTQLKQKIAKSAAMIMKSLPGVKIYLHNNQSETHQALADATGRSVDDISKEVGNAAGSQVKGEIHINMETAKETTVLHEAFHEAILRSGKSTKNITDFANGLKNIISDKDVKAKLDEFVSMYEESDKSEEFLSELGAIMAEAETELTTTKLQQFLNLINRIAKRLGLPVILKSTATAQEAVDFINSMSKSLRTGEVIAVSDVINVDTNELSIKQDKTGDFDISYFEDANEFKKLVKEGLVENNYDINKISGEVVAVHQPDNMFVGTLKNLDKEIFNGNGGVFYTSITGNVWASGAESSAKSLANLINKSLEESTDGVGRLVLVRGTDSKMISSTEGVKASMSIIELLVDKGLINRSEFRSSLIRVGKKFNIDFSGKDSSAAIHKDIKEKFMDVKNSTFQKRGDFFDEVINDLSKTSKSATENIDGIRKALGSKRKISFSKDGIRDSIGDILTERLLKDLPNSHAYAIIEVTEPVTYRENKGHDSYPWILESKSKPKLKLLSDRNHAVKDGVFEMIDGSVVTQGKLGLAQRGMGIAKISQQPSKIKLQKTPQETRMDKESENVFKKSMDRGTNWATATQNALDYIQKSKWYQEATDIEREQKVRDFKESKKQKLKKAPSVAKVLGKPKLEIQTKTVNALRKEFFTAWNKSAREAKGDLNSKRKSLSDAIKGMVKLGKLKVSQASTIIKRVSQVNLDNPVMVERLIDYAAKVFDRADYQERLNNAFSYRRAIKRLLKSDNQAQVVGMANEFAKIDPSMIENIDDYIAMAEIVKNAVAPSKIKGLDVVLKESANIEAVSNFSKDALEKQEQKLKDELLATNNDLLESGVISGDMTIKEIQEILNAIKDTEYKMDSQEKERYIRSYLSKRFESLASIVTEIIKTNENPLTGEQVAITVNDRAIISDLLNVDLSEMSIRDAIFAVEAMDNFVNNGITSKIEGALSAYKGQIGLKQEIKSGKVARALKLFFSKKIGKYFATEFTPLPLMIERMFSGVKSGVNVMKSMGLDVVINGVNKANNLHEKIINEYYEKFIKNSKTFHNPENVYERGMLSFLKRNVTGSLEEMKAETSRRISMIEESIATLMNDGNESQKAMAEIYQKVFDNLGVSTGDIDVIDSRASKENRDAVDWWVSEWSKQYKDLYDVSLSVYNYDLGSDINYTPDRYKTIKTETFDQALTERNSSFLINMDHMTDKGQTGVLMQANRPKVMPEGRYISLDFDTNNSSSLKGALVDINTAAGIRQVDGFLNSKLLSKLIPTSEDRDVLIQRTNRYIRRAKGKIFIPSDLYKDVDAALNFAASLGVGKALGGVLQSVKQTIPIAISTAINTGKFNMSSFEFNEWLNNTGMPISNRGIESLSTIESMDRRMEAKGTKVRDSLKWIQEKQQLYVKWFLSKPDVFIARSGFQSYYLQYMGEKSIDWANHTPNKDALNYAQAMVDRQQNISDPMLGGEFLTAEDGMKRMAKKILFPFASFGLNQKARLYSDIINMGSKTTSTEDRKIATKSAAATIAEMLAYRAISVGIGYGFYKAAAAIISGFIGDDDDDDKENDKKWLESSTKFPIKSMINDIFSPIQMTDRYVTMSTDFLLSLTTGDTDAELDELVKQENEIRSLKDQDAMTDPQEEKFRQESKNKSLYQVGSKYDDNAGLGMISIASDLYKKIYDDYSLATTGEFEDDYKGNITVKKIRPIEQDLMKNTLYFSALFAMGVLPKESDQMVTKVVNMVKKNAMSESEYEKYEDFKKEFKREPSPFEIGLIKSDKKYDYISKDIDWVNRGGGLTLDQGKEYVKLLNIMGEVNSSTLLEIKAGKTADQISKSMRAKL